MTAELRGEKTVWLGVKRHVCGLVIRRPVDGKMKRWSR